MSENEKIDIYDENRKHTGLVLERKAKLEKGQYMLYVLALIRNADGKFLITRRSLDKKWAAGWWEIPGGGALAGETSEMAVCREVSEETGLDISNAKKSVAYSYRNDDLKGGDNYFADIYLIEKDFGLQDVTIQKSEVLDRRLASLDEIKKLADTDGFLHYKRICETLGL